MPSNQTNKYNSHLIVIIRFLKQNHFIKSQYTNQNYDIS